MLSGTVLSFVFALSLYPLRHIIIILFHFYLSVCYAFTAKPLHQFKWNLTRRYFDFWERTETHYCGNRYKIYYNQFIWQYNWIGKTYSFPLVRSFLAISSDLGVIFKTLNYILKRGDHPVATLACLFLVISFLYRMMRGTK